MRTLGSSTSRWDRVVGSAVIATALLMVSFHMINTQFLMGSTYELQNVHLLFALVLTFLPSLSGGSLISRTLGLCLVCASIIGTLYVGFNIDHLQMVMGFPEAVDVAVGVVLIVLVIEATRRSWGLSLPIVAAVFLAYFFFGHLIPGPLYHREFNFDYIISYLSVGLTGIYGQFLTISANQIFLFVVFGSLFAVLGIDSLLSELGKLAGRRLRSGPGQMAVVSSSLVGMITGASVANVAVTGAFTIPYMKKRGYSPELAGAIEATASTGGQIMPPVMGAAAFLMAFFIGIPYVEVMLVGIIPAVLFYIGVLASVHFASLAEDIDAPTERADMKAILKGAPAFLIPLGIIIVLLIKSYAPDVAAFWAIVAALTLSMLRPDRPKLGELLNCMAGGALVGAKIAVSLAVVGIIAQTLITTGLGSKIAGLIELFSMGNIILALLITMIVAIILGCGVPPAAAYSLVAITAAPSLVRMGVDPLAAHFFAFYFAIMSAVTPPVAMGALAATALSGGRYMATSVKGFKMAISGFIIPFFIVFNPVARLHVEHPGLAAGAIIAMPISLIALSAAIYGYLLTRLTLMERVMISASALLAFGFMTFRQMAHLPLEWPMLAGCLILFGVVMTKQISRHRSSGQQHQTLDRSEV